MAKVTLPTGCSGLDFADGTKYDADSRGRVDLGTGHSKYLKTSFYGQTGIMHDNQSLSFGTKQARLCRACNRAWNAWSKRCPRCGRFTAKQGENA